MGWHRNLTSIIVVAVAIASCGLPTTNAAPDHLPTMAMAAAMQNENAEIKFTYQELVRESNDASPKFQGQPYPSDPNGGRAGGWTVANFPNDQSVGLIGFEHSPAPESIQLPAGLQPSPGNALEFFSTGQCNSVTVWAYPAPKSRDPDTDAETTLIYDNTDNTKPSNDLVCDFIFPGTLAHRILPPQPPPTDIDAYFAELAKHPFTYDHNIHMYGETVYVYKWETVTDGITEIREVGVTPDDRLFYLNWWRSEPYDGEEVTRRIVRRSCAGTCD